MPDKRYPNYVPRIVSDNWLVDTEYHIPVDTAKLPPGFIFTKGMLYQDAVDATKQGGGMSDPLPQLKEVTTPTWWVSTNPLLPVPPWNGFVLVDLKEGSEFMLWAVFAHNTIASAKLKPSVSFETEEDWSFPAVCAAKGLLDLTNIIAAGNLTGTISNIYFQDETRTKCKVKVSQWWTTTPWKASQLKSGLDVTGEARDIYYSYPNGANLRRSCLHETIITPSLSIASINGQTAAVSVPLREFPATRLTTWQPDQRNRINEVGGRYFRERKIYYPPYDPLDKRKLPRNLSS